MVLAGLIEYIDASNIIKISKCNMHGYSIGIGWLYCSLNIEENNVAARVSVRIMKGTYRLLDIKY